MRVVEDACLSIPSSCLLKAPRVRQRKRGPLLSLSLPARPCSSRSLSLSLLLCAQVWALTHQLQQQLLTGKKHKTPKDSAPWGAKRTAVSRSEATHLGGGAACSARVAVRRGGGKKFWEGTSSFVLWSPPFVYTCDRWMGLLLAAPSSFRSPKSPALSKSNNYAHNNIDGPSVCLSTHCDSLCCTRVCIYIFKLGKFAQSIHLLSPTHLMNSVPTCHEKEYSS